MADVITTLTLTVEYETARRGTIVVGEYSSLTDVIRQTLWTRFGAAWPDSEHFEIDLQYARTVSLTLTQLGDGALHFRPRDARVPLDLIVETASELAQARENWAVRTVEVLEEVPSYEFRHDFEELVLFSTCVVRVTQSKP